MENLFFIFLRAINKNGHRINQEIPHIVAAVATKKYAHKARR